MTVTKKAPAAKAPAATTAPKAAARTPRATKAPATGAVKTAPAKAPAKATPKAPAKKSSIVKTRSGKQIIKYESGAARAYVNPRGTKSEHGYVEGSLRQIAAEALTAGGATRFAVVQRLNKEQKGKTANGRPVNWSAIVSNTATELEARGYTVESTWKMVAPDGTRVGATKPTAKGGTRVGRAKPVVKGKTEPALKDAPVVKEAVAKPVRTRKVAASAGVQTNPALTAGPSPEPAADADAAPVAKKRVARRKA